MGRIQMYILSLKWSIFVPFQASGPHSNFCLPHKNHGSVLRVLSEVALQIVFRHEHRWRVRMRARLRRVSAYKSSLLVMAWVAEQQRPGMTWAFSQHHWAQTEGFSQTHGSNVEIFMHKHTFQNYSGFLLSAPLSVVLSLYYGNHKNYALQHI